MLNPTLTERAADFWSDRQLQQFDDAAAAQEEALERATAVVTLDDVLEALAGLNADAQQKLVDAYRDTSDRAYFQWLLQTAFEDAFTAAARRIAEHSGAGRVQPVGVTVWRKEA
ncbi:hypothetical protein NTJ56_08670 [Burkholderia contaminans]|uniref:hypothetical protein n=1 Tax=Burkholderia contaminans TaxID=488447 RepID=UPI00215029C1|nr:hypothetical protein [Burkholderia contaminans]UUX38859.1 hypothetical protein NTJ56_08670 [Burkholderia contaminans]